MSMYSFPSSLPQDDGVALWQLQLLLLHECQNRFGTRNLQKRIYQPIFIENGPCVFNTPNLDGAFAALSNNARTYWPTTLYELAHETVHLLDPITGYTNYLEEGFAVAFSVEMSKAYTQCHQQPTEGPYFEAWNLVCELDSDSYRAASNIRERCGSLGAVSPEQLSELFPNVVLCTIDRLCSECNFT